MDACCAPQMQSYRRTQIPLPGGGGRYVGSERASDSGDSIFYEDLQQSRRSSARPAFVVMSPRRDLKLAFREGDIRRESSVRQVG